MKKVKALAIILCVFVWFSIAIGFQPNHLVSESELESYAKTFLQIYYDKVNQFNLSDRIYFQTFRDFINKTTMINAELSEIHGAAIELVINNQYQRLQQGKSSLRIEQVALGGDFFKDYGANGIPIKLRGDVILTFESGVVFLVGGRTPFEILGNATVQFFPYNWTIDDRSLFNPLIVKGSNMFFSWTAQNAVSDAKFGFRWDLAGAMNSSEGVREYVAISELKDQLDNIAKKLREDPNYLGPQLQTDLTNLANLALEKYGVTRPQFIQDELDILGQKNNLSNKLPLTPIEYTTDYWYTIYFVILLNLSYALPLLIPKMLGKSRKDLADRLEKVVNGSSMFFVLYLYATSMPYGFDWVNNSAILITQFIIFYLVIRFARDIKTYLKFHWRGTLGKALFVALFLGICLGLMLYISIILYSQSYLFIGQSIALGKVTPISLITATLSVLFIILSQRAFGKIGPLREKGLHRI